MGICIFMPAPIGGYLAAADGSQATQSGSAHVRMAVPRCLVLGGRWCQGGSDRGTGRPTVGLGLHKGKSGSFYQWFPLWKVPGTSPFPVAPGTGN